MKVWEKIVTKFEDTKGMTKEKLIQHIVAYRFYPCLINAKYKFLNEEKMNEICSKYGAPLSLCCIVEEGCLKEYLDAEID